MKRKMGPDTVTGTLTRKDGMWHAATQAGTFPLAASLQSRPAEDCDGARIEATIEARQVTAYHFVGESLD